MSCFVILYRTHVNYTNSIGTCTFTRQGRNTYNLSQDLTLKIPDGVDMLYFVCDTDRYTYIGSMSVSDIKDSANAQKTLNTITRQLR